MEMIVEHTDVRCMGIKSYIVPKKRGNSIEVMHCATVIGYTCMRVTKYAGGAIVAWM